MTYVILIAYRSNEKVKHTEKFVCNAATLVSIKILYCVSIYQYQLLKQFESHYYVLCKFSCFYQKRRTQTLIEVKFFSISYSYHIMYSHKIGFMK